ncbi:MAG: T9SS type A sorting domain-containing protein [Bacteroidales bacterium]|nr:T9SS type A sorting domain-containing protein [Bacteroidales bacterium]
MKTRFFLAIVAIVLSGNFAFGQNKEIRLTSTTGKIITSVFLSNPNNGNNYLIGIDEYIKLFITPFNNTPPYLQPNNIDARAFQLTDTYGKIHINGGFFDWDENIVVYGNSETKNFGVIIKITMTNGLPTEVKIVVNISYANSIIIDGCASRRQITNIPPTYGNTYDFISKRDGGCLLRYDDNLNFYYPARTLNNGSFLSISWDDDLKKHVVSGNMGNNNVVGYFNESFPSILSSGTFQYLTPTSFNLSVGTNCHVQAGNNYIYDTIVYLCQDIRSAGGDGIWFTKINYLTGLWSYSYVYQFPYEKVLIIDAIHNFMNFFILGHHNGFDGYENFERRYIAQIDLSDPTIKICKHIDYIDLDTLPWLSSYHILQQAFLNNIALDPIDYNVFSSGSDLNYSYLMKTFDMNEDNCNTEIDISMPQMQFNQIAYQANTVTSALTYDLGITATINTYSNYILTDDILCDSYGSASQSKYYNYIPEIKQRIENRTTINNKINKYTSMSTESKDIPSLIIFENRHFECKNFEGTITYKIYNLQGQLVFKGQTNNNVQNNMPICDQGLYFIQLNDKNNNVIISKLKITN